MTIEEVKDRLINCAEKKDCFKCKHSFYGQPTANCKEHIVREMGNECAKIVEQEGDDGK